VTRLRVGRDERLLSAIVSVINPIIGQLRFSFHFTDARRPCHENQTRSTTRAATRRRFREPSSVQIHFTVSLAVSFDLEQSGNAAPLPLLPLFFAEGSERLRAADCRLGFHFRLCEIMRRDLSFDLISLRL